MSGNWTSEDNASDTNYDYSGDDYHYSNYYDGKSRSNSFQLKLYSKI